MELVDYPTNEVVTRTLVLPAINRAAVRSAVLNFVNEYNSGLPIDDELKTAEKILRARQSCNLNELDVELDSELDSKLANIASDLDVSVIVLVVAILSKADLVEL